MQFLILSQKILHLLKSQTKLSKLLISLKKNKKKLSKQKYSLIKKERYLDQQLQRVPCFISYVLLYVSCLICINSHQNHSKTSSLRQWMKRHNKDQKEYQHFEKKLDILSSNGSQEDFLFLIKLFSLLWLHSVLCKRRQYKWNLSKEIWISYLIVSPKLVNQIQLMIGCLLIIGIWFKD